MSDHDSSHGLPAAHDSQVPDGLPDDQNPAVADLKLTFKITMLGGAIYIGVIFVYIFLL